MHVYTISEIYDRDVYFIIKQEIINYYVRMMGPLIQ